MAGELWRVKGQAAVEVTAGTPVAATRPVYWKDLVFTNERDGTMWDFPVGRRDNVLDHTLGPVQIGGSGSLPMSSSEIIELLLTGIKGGVTPTQPAAISDPTVYLWTFKPGNTLDSMTVEWNDAARAWQIAGVRANSLKFSGSVGGENTIAAEFFGTAMVLNALTGGLADRTPSFMRGWETKLYIDAFGGTAGTTNIAATLISWEITIGNNLVREYYADNTQNAADVTPDPLAITARLTVRASSTQAATEFANWNAETKRLIRVEWGQNKVISNAYKEFVTVDVPGSWTAVGLGGNENNRRTYELNLQYVYDPTLAAGVQVRAQNTRSVAWGIT